MSNNWSKGVAFKKKDREIETLNLAVKNVKAMLNDLQESSQQEIQEKDATIKSLRETIKNLNEKCRGLQVTASKLVQKVEEAREEPPPSASVSQICGYVGKFVNQNLHFLFSCA